MIGIGGIPFYVHLLFGGEILIFRAMILFLKGALFLLFFVGDVSTLGPATEWSVVGPILPTLPVTLATPIAISMTPTISRPSGQNSLVVSLGTGIASSD